MGLIQWLKEWIETDTKDREYNEIFCDPNEPETRKDNADLERRIDYASRLLKACEKEPWRHS